MAACSFVEKHLAWITARADFPVLIIAAVKRFLVIHSIFII